MFVVSTAIQRPAPPGWRPRPSGSLVSRSWAEGPQVLANSFKWCFLLDKLIYIESFVSLDMIDSWPFEWLWIDFNLGIYFFLPCFLHVQLFIPVFLEVRVVITTLRKHDPQPSAPKRPRKWGSLEQKGLSNCQTSSKHVQTLVSWPQSTINKWITENHWERTTSLSIRGSSFKYRLWVLRAWWAWDNWEHVFNCCGHAFYQLLMPRDGNSSTGARAIFLKSHFSVKKNCQEKLLLWVWIQCMIAKNNAKC